MSDLTVDSGTFRHVVTIQKPVHTVVDAMGAQTVTWTAQFSDVRAEIRPLRGDQYLSGQQLASVVDTKVRIRYHAGVCPQWRVLWGARVFLIVTVIDPEMRHVFLDLMAKEIFEAGS